MRRQHLPWTITVFGIVGTIYGAYLLAYHFNHGKGLFAPALALLIFGVLALAVSAIMHISNYLASKKKKDEPLPMKEEKVEEVETPKEEIKPIPCSKPVSKTKDKAEYSSRSSYSSSYSYSTVYVKQVGYGPLLRIEGNRIIDMRTNTYYRIEDNLVKQEGYGPLFEIRGNQIKDAFGSYLYEISGSNINKVFGGFYASISGNYITLFDLSIKYEMTDSLSKRQLLAVAALLFGRY